jgi:hypothetical protein
LENAGHAAGLLSPAADPPAPAPPASTPTTASTYNHHLCFFDQFVCFGASRSGDACWSRFSAFWRHDRTDRCKANDSNGGARQYISEHIAATDIHVSAPFFKTSVVFQSPNGNYRRDFACYTVPISAHCSRVDKTWRSIGRREESPSATTSAIG